MNKTKLALDWIAEGNLRKDMASALGMTPEECRQLVSNMQRAGYIASSYVLTDKGQQRAEYMSQEPSKALMRRRSYYDPAETAKRKTDQMVSSAIKANANSVFSLGSMA